MNVVLKQEEYLWNTSQTKPLLNYPVLALIQKRNQEYALVFYTQNKTYEIDNDEAYTSCIGGKYYLNEGWYYLYENLPVGYPIIEWKYFQ